MITRGIIEQRVDAYHVKVRIPLVDKVLTAPIHTPTENLTTAILATIPGLEVELVPGDVVIVSTDKCEDTAIILGYLYRDASRDKICKLKLESLHVVDSAELPRNTNIGNVTAAELNFLSGARDNLQRQIDDIRVLLDNMKG